ncbi:ribosomal protein S16 [Hysterangium stoloniferum]|nr:ribosomal protein S16 [Hysterangium stoloniferum]
MTVRLRMAIHGKRNNRIFHLVAIDLRKRRDAKPIETLGIYRPTLKHGETQKQVEWSVERIQYWLGLGAQPSKTFERLINLGGINRSIEGAEVSKAQAPEPPSP